MTSTITTLTLLFSDAIHGRSVLPGPGLQYNVYGKHGYDGPEATVSKYIGAYFCVVFFFYYYFLLFSFLFSAATNWILPFCYGIS